MMNEKGLDPNAGKKEAPPAPKGEKASDIEEMDLAIAVALGQRMLVDAGGLDAITKAVQSTADPAQVISKFLVQLLLKIKDACSAQGVELSPSIVLGRGGWVEQMLELVEDKLKFPEEWSVEILDDIMETFKAMSQSPQQGGQSPQGGAPAQQPQPAAGGLDNVGP